MYSRDSRYSSVKVRSGGIKKGRGVLDLDGEFEGEKKKGNKIVQREPRV